MKKKIGWDQTFPQHLLTPEDYRTLTTWKFLKERKSEPVKLFFK